MRTRNVLAALLVPALLVACTDHGNDLLRPPPAMSLDEAAVDHDVPSRTEDYGAQWTEISDAELWAYLAANDSLATVGLKAPGARRGVWRDRMLVDVSARAQGAVVVNSLAGIEIVASDTLLPVSLCPCARRNSSLRASCALIC